MDFDYQRFDWLAAFVRWTIVFFACFSCGGFLTLVFAPSVAGRHGRRKLIRHLTRGVMGPVCLVTALAAGLGVGYGLWKSPESYASVVEGFVWFAGRITFGRVTDEAVLSTIGRNAVLLSGVGFAAIGGFMIVPTLIDSLTWSLRRIVSVAMLTWKEAVRRRALYVFVVFALLFMFAGWFLSESSDRAQSQVKVYVSFVLTVVSYLIIPVVLLLSCWAIPEDIRVRSLHTVVTKPIRRSEIYLGRILGFSMVGTVVLVVMGTIGYVWITRQVPASLTVGEATVAGEEIVFGRTVDGVRVAVTDIEGEEEVFEAASEAELRQSNPEVYTKYQAARDSFVAGLLTSRVPKHGTLSFYDQEGRPTEYGINVGDVWEHRSYVQGATKARASYLFEDFGPDLMVDVEEVVEGEVVTSKRLRLESTFEAFRSQKGDMNQSLLVAYHFVKDVRRSLSRAAKGTIGTTGDEVGTVPRLGALSNAIRDGDFGEAANQFGLVGTGIKNESRLSSGERADIARGYQQVAGLLEPFSTRAEEPLAWAGDAAETARAVSAAARNNDQAGVGDGLIRLGELFRENTDSAKESIVDVDVALPPFNIQEYGQNVMMVDRTLRLPGQSRTVDLFDDLVHGGRIRIEVACLDKGQYLGMARPDLFVRKPDLPFASGYWKALFGVWLMMVLVIVFGVTASTFVKGPVATLLTFVLVLVGLFFHDFMQEVVSGELDGGGTFESINRIVTHLNPMVDLDDTAAVRVMKGVDQTINGGLWVVSQVIPDLSVFGLSKWVADGFDIPWNADSGLAACVATTLAYLLPCLMLGYYSLKLRELEAK